MNSSKYVSMEEATASSDLPMLQAGFVGDLSGLSRAMRGGLPPAELKTALEALSPENADVNKPGILQSGSGIENGTIGNTLKALLEIAAAAALIDEAGKEAVHGNNTSLQEVRKHLAKGIKEVAALEWAPSSNANLSCWSDPPEQSCIDWVGKIFAEEGSKPNAVEGTAFQILVVYQHLRFLLGLEDELAWRTVSTPVLGADNGGLGGLRMLLTVSLIPSPLEGFIPDLRYFGLTELKHGEKEHCLLNSAQRCWAAARVSGYRGVWRLEHSSIESTSEMMNVPHVYGRSFEAAFVCCLRAAAGNAYGEKLPDDESEHPPLLAVDPLSRTVAISAKLGDFDTQTAVKDIPLIPVTGVPQKLCEALGTEITQVVFADGQWAQEAEKNLDPKDREDRQRSQNLAQTPENRSRLQWSTAANIGAALDALLVRSQWLKAWQKQVRLNWLQRWEARSEGSPGARAPGDNEPGPDEKNKPKSDVANAAVADDSAASAG